MEELKRNCELCNGETSIYCPSDNAFLCFTCDSEVHCANFLVARHVRSFLCPNCRILNGNRFSGTGVSPLTMVSCRNCDPKVAAAVVEDSGDNDDDSLSSSSSCVSSTGEEMETTSLGKRTEKVRGIDVKRREKRCKVVADSKVEGILVNWCKKMGGVVEERQIGAVVNMSVDLIRGCFSKITSLPFRVSLATSFWVAVRVVCRRGGSQSSSTCQYLRKVEQISRVPAKLILATEMKLVRVIKRRQSSDNHEEGWAEC